MAFATGLVGDVFRDALVAAVLAAVTDSYDWTDESGSGSLAVGLGTPPAAVLDAGADALSVGEVESNLVAATLGPQRAMDEQLTATLRLNVGVPGGAEAEKTASDRAIGYVRQVEAYLRFVDPYVGGTVQRAFVSQALIVSDAYTDPNTILGRLCELQVTVSAWQRSERTP